MRLDSGDQDGRLIDGNGVYTEDPTAPQHPERPLVRDMPDLEVVVPRKELDDDRTRLRETIKGASEVRPLPGMPKPLWGDNGKGLDDNN